MMVYPQKDIGGCLVCNYEVRCWLYGTIPYVPTYSISDPDRTGSVIQANQSEFLDIELESAEDFPDLKRRLSLSGSTNQRVSN